MGGSRELGLIDEIGFELNGLVEDSTGPFLSDRLLELMMISRALETVDRGLGVSVDQRSGSVVSAALSRRSLSWLGQLSCWTRMGLLLLGFLGLSQW